MGTFGRARDRGAAIRGFPPAVAAALVFLLAAPAFAEEDNGSRRYIFGAPEDPTEEWILAQGGRLYDMWWAAMGSRWPDGTHPSWPTEDPRRGPNTWRCVSCHGWDYRGGDGASADRLPSPDFPGIADYAGAAPETVLAIIRDDTHRYDEDMIPDAAGRALALFVSRGQHDADRWIDRDTGAVAGDPESGRRLFQNVCAICHDFDGRAEITGEEEWLSTIGEIATANPWMALHKIRNGQPSADMLALRSFGMNIAVDVLSHAQSLPGATED